MNIEDAIDVLYWALNRLDGHQYIIDEYGNVDVKAKTDAFGKAIEALEKQIPKKPNGYNCPVCGWGVVGRWDAMKFCRHCGQAIEWSE